MRENPDADNSSSFKGPFLSLKKCVENALDFADKWSYDMVFHKGDSDYLLLTGTIRDVLGSGKYDDVEITVSPF